MAIKKDSKIKIIKPTYYDSFCCSAGACSFTCCRDWKIAVDPLTEEKWKTLSIPETIKAGGEASCLISCVRTGWGGSQISLREDGFCPLLTEDQLCSIVCAYGEESISETCHTFPRERHVFGDRIEETLTMGCPAALDLLWAEEDFRQKAVSMALSEGPGRKNHQTGEEDSQAREDVLRAREALSQAPAAWGPALELRDRLCCLMQDSANTVSGALKMAFYILLDYDEKFGSGEEDRAGEAIEAYGRDIFAPAFLAELRTTIGELPRDAYDHFMEQNELFLDLAENYRKKQIYTEILTPLAEAAETFEKKSAKKKALAARDRFEPIWEAYDRQIRLLMTEEIYSTLYLPAGDSYTMLLKLEWLGIFYAVLKQCAFLTWHKNGESLTEEELKSLVVVLIRMTGYSEDDIEEYLENSFEAIVWGWGYMALIV